MKSIRRFTVRTVLPEPIRPLARLATNLRWSWHRPTRELFASLSPALWEEAHHDPIALLGSIGREQLQDLADNGDVVDRVRAAAADLDRYLSEPRWYQGLGPDAPACIAYFSPGFGISEVLPQYSGGLGILAGDPQADRFTLTKEAFASSGNSTARKIHGPACTGRAGASRQNNSPLPTCQHSKEWDSCTY